MISRRRAAWKFGIICKHVAIDKAIHGAKAEDEEECMLVQMHESQGRLFALKMRTARGRFAMDHAKRRSREGCLGRITDERCADAAEANGWKEVLEYRGLDYEFDGYVADYYMVEVSANDHYLPMIGKLCNEYVLCEGEVAAQKAAGWAKSNTDQKMIPPAAPDHQSSRWPNAAPLTVRRGVDGRATLRSSSGVIQGLKLSSSRWTTGFGVMAEGCSRCGKPNVVVKPSVFGNWEGASRADTRSAEVLRKRKMLDVEEDGGEEANAKKKPKVQESEDRDQEEGGDRVGTASKEASAQRKVQANNSFLSRVFGGLKGLRR